MRKAASDLKSKAGGGMRRARSEAALQTRQPGALSELALAAGAGAERMDECITVVYQPVCLQARTPDRGAHVGELGLPPEAGPAPAVCLRAGGWQLRGAEASALLFDTDASYAGPVCHGACPTAWAGDAEPGLAPPASV